MTRESLKDLSDNEIKKFLETASLYSWYEYNKPLINRRSLWISEIDAYCDIREMDRPFHDLRNRGGGAGLPSIELKSGTSYFEFTCVSCKKNHRKFLVEQVLEDSKIRIQKYGELPRSKIARNKLLQKFLENDLDSYEKAIICLSYKYGIAAFAYFRRIVENNISKLLDDVLEDTSSSDKTKSIVDALGELRKDVPMSDKIKVANSALPNYLKPNGLNPLGQLYQILSEGVHSYSDEECLNKAKVINDCLTYLVSELAARKSNRTNFISNIGNLKT